MKFENNEFGIIINKIKKTFIITLRKLIFSFLHLLEYKKLNKSNIIITRIIIHLVVLGIIGAVKMTNIKMILNNKLTFFYFTCFILLLH